MRTFYQGKHVHVKTPHSITLLNQKDFIRTDYLHSIMHHTVSYMFVSLCITMFVCTYIVCTRYNVPSDLQVKN